MEQTLRHRSKWSSGTVTSTSPKTKTKTKISTILITSCILLLLILPSITNANEVCDICGSGPSPNITDPTAIFTYLTDSNIEDSMTCTEGSVAALNGFFSNCTALHLRAGPICCRELRPEVCPLCGSSDEPLPHPERMVAGKTCEEWQEDADGDFTDDCTAWQKSFGSYCGCDTSTPSFFEGQCLICTNKTLPYYDESFTWEDNRTEYCAIHEKEMNRLSYELDCGMEQERLYGACRCEGLVLPVVDEEGDDVSSGSRMDSSWGLGLVFGNGSWLSVSGIVTVVSTVMVLSFSGMMDSHR